MGCRKAARTALLLAALVCSCLSMRDTWVNVRIANLNILDGCRNDPDRLARIREWIIEEDLDVLGLNELNGWDEAELARQGQSWGHPYSEFMQTQTEGGTHYSLGITSRSPIVPVHHHLDGFWHGALHVKLQAQATHANSNRSSNSGIIDNELPGLSDDKPFVHVLVTHLNPSSAQDRMEEVKKLVQYVQGVENLILLGDLNSLSPIDAFFYEKMGAVDVLRSDPHLWKKFLLSDGSIDYGPITALYEVLVDVDYYSFLKKHEPFASHLSKYEQWTAPVFNSLFTAESLAEFETSQHMLSGAWEVVFEPSVPTPLNTDYSHATKMRLDYALVSKTVSSTHEIAVGYVVRNARTAALSDHYPIVVQLRIAEHL